MKKGVVFKAAPIAPEQRLRAAQAVGSGHVALVARRQDEQRRVRHALAQRQEPQAEVLGGCAQRPPEALDTLHDRHARQLPLAFEPPAPASPRLRTKKSRARALGQVQQGGCNRHSQATGVAAFRLREKI